MSLPRGRRLSGIAAATFVHLLLIAFVLSGLPKSAPIPRAVHEIMLVLMPKPKPVDVEPPPKAAPRRAAIPSWVRAPVPVIAPQVAPSVELRIPLFRCAPENFEKLSPEEQAKCSGIGIAPPDRRTVAALRSHVLDPARHEAELAARRTPARVDCTRLKHEVIQNIVQQDSLIVDPLCALGDIRHALGR
ncbi:MAG TPA: hypothetical protein VG889_20190 [Rhizomicrobium sp.]|nr:hypothetical protein [Rhizomicrobium sp.]